MNLKLEIAILWQDFEFALSEDHDAARIILGKLIKITKSVDERKKLLFSLVRAFNLSTNRFSIPTFQKYLKLCKIEHLEKEVVLNCGKLK